MFFRNAFFAAVLMRSLRRTPKNFDGSDTTLRHIRDLLPSIMKDIGHIYQEMGELILLAWPQIIGPQFAGMTQALSFERGVLTVAVKNSTLYSMLKAHERLRLLQVLREKFPASNIHNIHFRMG